MSEDKNNVVFLKESEVVNAKNSISRLKAIFDIEKNSKWMKRIM